MPLAGYGRWGAVKALRTQSRSGKSSRRAKIFTNSDTGSFSRPFGTGTSQRCNREELALLKRAGQIVVMLADEQATPEQLALLRRMTPERRLSLAEQLYWSARELKASWLRSQHTDWTEEQIGREVRRLFTNART